MKRSATVATWSLLLVVACGARTGLGGRGSEASSDASVDGPSGDDALPPPQPHPVGSPCAATAPTLLTTTKGGTIDQVAVDDGFVYFHHSGDKAAWGVSIVPKGGGSAFLVAQNIYEHETSVSAFALDATHITWIDPPVLKQAPIGGGAPTTFSDPGGSSYYDSINLGNGVFLVTKNDTILDAITPQGASTTLSSDILLSTGKVLADGNVLYGASWSGGMFRFENGIVKKYGTVGAFDFAFDATDLYFTEQYSSGNASIWRLAKAGGAATPIAVTGGAFGNGIALDGTHVYFADKGNVIRIGKDGTSPLQIGLPSDDETIGIALDDACVYWGTVAGRVFAAPK